MVSRTLFSVFGANVISKIFVGIYTILIIRLLSIEDFALYTIFLSVYSFIGGFLFSPVNQALVIHSSGREEDSTLLYKGFLLFEFIFFGLLLAVVFTFTRSITILVFSDVKYSASLLFGVIASLGLILGNTALSSYQKAENFKIYNIINILRPMFILGGILLLFLLDKISFKSIALVFLISQLVLFVQSFYHIIHDFVNFRMVIYKDLLLEFIRSRSLILWFFAILGCLEYIGVYVLTRYGDDTQLATYSVAFRYYSLGSLFIIPLHTVLLPRFAKGNTGGFIRKWTKNIWWLIFPLIIILLLIKPLYVFVNGIRYEESYVLFCIFCIALYFTLLCSPAVNILIGNKNDSFLLIVSLMSLLVNVSGNFYFMQKYGPVGIAVVTSLSHLIVYVSCSIKAYLADVPLSFPGKPEYN